MNSVRNGECDFLDAANKIEGHIKRFRQNTVGNDSGHSIAEILDSQGDRIFESRRGLSTGLPSIDKYVGGLCPGDLLVIGARPKKGKTSIMTTIAVLANVPALFFSLEMTALEIVRKLICIAGRIPGRELFNHRGEADAIKAELRERPLRIIDTPGLNAVDIAARSYSIPNLKLIVVDYAQILGRLPGAKDSRESLVESVKGLKVLAKRLNCAVIVGSQLNRESEGKVTPAGLAESDELLRSADCVLLLDWKFEDAPPETPFVQTPVEVEVQSVCRHNCGGKFPLLFYRGQGRFGEMAP
ncbi:MAG: AAA family ATPase [Planctomycetota bacterium]|nr:AAA family ATPase [Planctomycetota bacterium]